MENFTDKNEVDENKRDFVKKAAYAAPVIMTMAALPAFASTGSGQQPTGRQHRNPRRVSHGNGGGRQHRRKGGHNT